MNKTLIIVIFFFFIFPLKVGAQQQTSVRSMAVAQLYEYGQAVYDRGDYSQAAKVFSRLLSIDPANSGARNYAHKLNKKGEQVTIPPVPIVVAPVVTKEKVEQSMETPSQMTKSSYSNDDLKRDIQEADQAIIKLKDQVSDLRNQIAQGQEYLSK